MQHNFGFLFSRRLTLLIAAISASCLLLITGVAQAATTVVVDEDNLGIWGSGVETSTGTLEFVTGPGTPPLGAGSAQFALDTTSSGVILGTADLAGTRLDEFTTLAYSTYNSVGNNTVAPALQINIDYDLTDTTTGWQGRLVFEPYYDNTIVDGTWQTWDALAGRWWSTGTPVVGDTTATQDCPISSPCDLATLLSLYPDAGVQTGALSAVLFKAGSGWLAGYTGSVDAFTVGISGTDTTYDFETVPLCSTTCYVDAAGGSDSNKGNSSADALATIQKAIDTVDPNGTVIVANGTYTEALNVNKAGITIDGESLAGVIIDASSINDYSIDVTADDVILQDFTLVGNSTGSAAYGIKIAGPVPNRLSNITVQNVLVENSRRTGVDLNGVDGALIKDVEVKDVPSGNGLAITDSNDIVFENITTSNNAWGALAVYTFGRYYTLGSDNVTIQGTNSFGEPTKVYVQIGNYNDPANPAPVTNLTVNGFDYTVKNDTFRAGGENFTFYQITQADAIAYALGLATPADSYVNEIATGDFWVGQDVSTSMAIQTALDKAIPGDTVNVLPGAYNEIAEDRPQFGTGTGPYDFGLYLGTDDVTLQGVDSSGTPITDYNDSDIPQVISTAGSVFGTQGPFISGAGVTISGLDFTPVAPGNNKNVEVVGDDFTLVNSRVRMLDGGASVYISDFQFSGDDTSGTTTVTKFNVSDNWMDGGVVVVANGAGFGSPMSDLVISNNLIQNGNNWGISMNGALDGIGWLNHPVGVPMITGNTFDGNFGNVRFLGTYDSYDASSYWNDIIANNTFNDSWVVAYEGAGPDLRATELYSYTTRRQIASSVTTIQNEVDRASSGDTVQVGPGTFNEQVTVSTDDITLNGSGEAQTLLVSTDTCTNQMNSSATAGVRLLGDHSGITVSNLSVSGYDLGLDIGENIGKSIADVTVTNVTASDNCVHGILSQAGTTDGVSISNVTANNNGSGFFAGRGLWFINGTKADISITDSEFNDNRLVGIDISDGDVTGLTISNNTVTGNGDSGIGVLGPQGPNPNLVANNTVTDNGRFGIEIKNPSGTTTVSGNNVSLSAPGSETRDYAGIAVFRRGPGATNADQPTGVVVSSNTVSGYVEPNGDGEGFGIVVEGTGMIVQDNEVTGNDVGIQVQEGNPSPNTNATPYFDRGDATVAADVLVNNNDITGNGEGMRAVGTTNVTDATVNWWGDISGPSGEGTGTGDTVSANVVFCPWLTDSINGSPSSTGGAVAQNVDTGEVFCSIQEAIDDSDTLAGHTIDVFPGTYANDIVISKSLTLQGPNATTNACVASRSSEAVIKGVMKFSNVPDNVTIAGFHFDESVSASTEGAVNGNGAGNNLTVSHNLFTNIGERFAVVHGTETIGQNIRTGWVIDQNKVDTINVTNATAFLMWYLDQLNVTDNCIEDALYAGIQLDNTTNALISGNSVSNTTNQGIQIANNAANITVEYNTIDSANTDQKADKGGIRLYGESFTGPVTVQYNTITNSFNGVAIKSGDDVTGQSIAINRNSIDTTNTANGIYHDGAGDLDGTCNWWGAADGPATVGTGSNVTANVNFLPWLQSSDLENDPCVGGLTGAILVKKYNDLNGDGDDEFSQDPGLEGWEISLYDDQDNLIDGPKTTGTSGFVTFDVPFGTYEVRETLQDGWIATDGPTKVVVVDSENNQTVKLGNYQLGQITLGKWADDNADGGWQRADESGIEGWDFTIETLTSGATTFTPATKSTGPNGFTSYRDLLPGTYRVCETLPEGWNFTGLTTTQRTDAVTADINGDTICVEVVMDESGERADISFGNFELGQITVGKWLDANQDGNRQNSSESGIQGWDFSIEPLTTGATTLTPATQTTGPNGYTTFRGLLPGAYNVCETVPAGWIYTGYTKIQRTGDVTETINGNEVCLEVTVDESGKAASVSFGNYELQGSITIVKAANPAREQSPVEFGFDAGSLGTFSLFGTPDATLNSKSFADLQLGTYTFTETSAPGNWDLTDISCVGGQTSVDLANSTVSVTLSDESGVVCTFTNERRPQIGVMKYNDENANGVQDNAEAALSGWEISIFRNGQQEQSTKTTDSNGQVAFTSLVPGTTYQVCETQQPNWVNTDPGNPVVNGFVCQDVTVNYGEFARVTFGNTDSTLRVTSFTLVDATTEQDIQVLQDGDVLDLQNLPPQVNIRANVAGPVESVYLDVSNGVDYTRTENVEPYALFGDNTATGDYYGSAVSVGAYTLAATPYSEDDRGGDMGDTLSINFTVIDGTPPPENLKVTEFVLVDAATDTDIRVINDGDTIDRSTLTNPVNIVAKVNKPNEAGSVFFEISGDLHLTQTENFVPFALIGDNNGDYNGITLPLGSYTLKATPYTGEDRQGTVGDPLTISFSVVDNTPQPLIVTQFVLVDAVTNSDIRVINDGDTIDRSTLTNPVNIVAKVNKPNEAGSVFFEISGDLNRTRTENVIPFALAGDTNGDYNGITLPLGSYTLKATPYTGEDRQGDTGISLTISFDVVDTSVSAASAPIVESSAPEVPQIEGTSE